MDPRLLRHYNEELQFIRESGAEFAKQFPKIAGRLGLSGFDVVDPYVERLLEGFAFLAARVQLKLDDEFPKFTQALLETVYPHYLSPTPSMAVVEMQPGLREGSLATGVRVPRGTALRSQIGADEQTACEYRTAHDVTLWPIEIVQADYSTLLGAVNTVRLPYRVRSALRLRLRTSGGVRFDALPIESLPVFLRGDVDVTARLYEALLGHARAIVARPAGTDGAWHVVSGDSVVQPGGFDDAEALLPAGPRSFRGYRLLQEYFAFPQRFLFARLTGLAETLKRCASTEADVWVLFDHDDPALEGAVGPQHLALYCTPAVNLFPRVADRITLGDDRNEYHVVPDRTRPLDLEVWSVTEMVGHGNETRRRFGAFYAPGARGDALEEPSYYTVRREPRMLSERQRSRGTRSNYVGSEVFVSLVDGHEGAFKSDLTQLAVSTLCTNRDLPLHMPLGQKRTDFSLDSGAPVESIRCVAGPTPPRVSTAHGETAWRLVGHLALNYLPLADDGEKNASALRDLLALYADLGDATARRQIRAVQTVETGQIVRVLPGPGPLAYGRGVELTITCDESGFEGAAVFLFGAMIANFVARYVSVNSFTETVLRSSQRGEIMRWPAKIGQTPIL